ncbi:PAS modulated sigma54 specific transcriptional regulator, Fis family [Desulfofundulus kuznetsovii DSM 6115]|uniref:HTH-type transcriptional regulatory protein TyrR n=1 Tax=Desulfofundulus kuznetsovii (strain DSM 6115 / VKM B-1805 / 17) TaxID=760568 RepID=A0AAU8PEK2_DESK7|nr:PAS modulated sigma54 specific transcriptional regulator, Fis family [Desulfofundulus kuznetsovii DSM 6115]
MLLVDAGGRVEFLNRAAEDLLGVERSAVAGRQIGDVLPAALVEQLWPQDGSPSGRKVEINGRKVAVQVNPLVGEEGAGGTMLVLQDISLCESLREAKEELEAIFNSSYDEIYVVDGEGYTRRVNKIGESYYGVEVEKIIGKHYSEMEEEGYFNPSVSRRVFEERRRVTMVQHTKTGKTLIVTGNPVFDDSGRITRIVVNSRDVSELINLKQRLEDTEQLVDNYRRLVMYLRQEKLENTEIIAASPQMKQVLDLVDRVAQVDSTILITGESGVGKGVVASRIHRLSKRHKGPFITINCGAIPENLLESELFGYEPGAFTGARREGKKGLIEMGDGGTVFLDEVADLPLNLQVKLLQVIQEKKLMRVGGSQQIAVNVRFIAATNRDVQKMVREGLFREDLYYRLNVVPVTIPPLRYRKEDIVPLIEHFVNKFNLKYDMNKHFSPEVLDVLVKYHWPGNVREVENLVERLMVTTDSNLIETVHIPDYIINSNGELPGRVYVLGICPLKQAVDEVERQLIMLASQRCKTTYEMASALQVNQSTIVRKIQKYRVHPTGSKQKKFMKNTK